MFYDVTADTDKNNRSSLDNRLLTIDFCSDHVFGALSVWHTILKGCQRTQIKVERAAAHRITWVALRPLSDQNTTIFLTDHPYVILLNSYCLLAT